MWEYDRDPKGKWTRYSVRRRGDRRLDHHCGLTIAIGVVYQGDGRGTVQKHGAIREVQTWAEGMAKLLGRSLAHEVQVVDVSDWTPNDVSESVASWLTFHRIATDKGGLREPKRRRPMWTNGDLGH